MISNREQLSPEDAERWEFCGALVAAVESGQWPNGIPALDEWSLRFATHFASEPRALLNNQREAIDDLRTACLGKL